MVIFNSYVKLPESIYWVMIWITPIDGESLGWSWHCVFHYHATCPWRICSGWNGALCVPNGGGLSNCRWAVAVVKTVVLWDFIVIFHGIFYWFNGIFSWDIPNLVNVYSLRTWTWPYLVTMEHEPFIVDLPIKHGYFPVRYVNVDQAGYDGCWGAMKSVWQHARSP